MSLVHKKNISSIVHKKLTHNKQHSGQSDQSLSKVDEETEAKIGEIRAAAEDKKQDALDKMMKAITQVETKPHENYRV